MEKEKKQLEYVPVITQETVRAETKGVERMKKGKTKSPLDKFDPIEQIALIITLKSIFKENYEKGYKQGKKDVLKGISDLKHRELPRWCLFPRGDDDFCERFSEYIVEVERYYRDDPKHKWNYYNGFCRYHLREGLKRLKQGSVYIGVNIVNVWRFKKELSE